MTPLESEFLQQLGSAHQRFVEAVSISIFFYGTPSFPVLWGPPTSLLTGMFFVFFSTSVVNFKFKFVLVFSFCGATYPQSRSDPRNLAGGEDLLTAQQQSYL